MPLVLGFAILLYTFCASHISVVVLLGIRGAVAAFFISVPAVLTPDTTHFTALSSCGTHGTHDTFKSLIAVGSIFAFKRTFAPILPAVALALFGSYPALPATFSIPLEIACPPAFARVDNASHPSHILAPIGARGVPIVPYLARPHPISHIPHIVLHTT